MGIVKHEVQDIREVINWGARIRTWINGSKVRCAAVAPRPNGPTFEAGRRNCNIAWAGHHAVPLLRDAAIFAGCCRDSVPASSYQAVSSSSTKPILRASS